MSNYSDFFEKPLYANNNNKTGICMEMCPPEEITLRLKEKLVHVLEVTRTGHKMVKCYCRSAADCNLAVPQLLRPFPVLTDTVSYLLLEVPKRTDIKKMTIIYDFINDRLRAVRQDMTIQRLPPEECTVLLEPMIRFYIYYGYRLCDHPLSEYDPVLNKNYVLECTKWFLQCCDDLQKADRIEENIDAITENLNSLNICTTRMKLSCDRNLVESLYILSNLNDMHPLYRYLYLPNYVKRVSALKLAYNIALAYQTGNYIRVFKLAEQLCPLTFSALCLHLPAIQMRALRVMSRAYDSQHLAVPAAVLKNWLGFNSLEEVLAACAHFGLRVVEEKDAICFSKATYNESEQLKPTKYFRAKVLQLELEEVLSYTI